MLGRAHPSSPLPLLSALHDWHLANRAVFGTFAGRELVAHYGSGENEQADLKRLGLVDMSLWPRRGYRGPGVADWLGAGVPLPAAVNVVRQTDAGDLILRPAAAEYWCLSSLSGPMAGEMPGAPAERPACGVYDLACQHSHALFALGGAHAPACLSRLCALDLRPDRFGPGAMAQTLIAGVSAIVFRPGSSDPPVYLLFCESGLARYLWASLLHAGREFEAAAVGYEALRSTLAQSPQPPDGGSMS